MIPARDFGSERVACRAFQKNKIPRRFRFLRGEPIDRGLRLRAPDLFEVMRNVRVQIARIDETVERNDFDSGFVRSIHILCRRVGVHRLNDQHRRAIRNRLLQSQFMRGRILFKESPARMAAIAGRENVAPPDPTPLDPKNTYTLNGNFYLLHRYANGQEINQYSIEFQLVNFASGEILPVGSQYVVKQWNK